MKRDQDKTKELLVNELTELRRRVRELEASHPSTDKTEY